MLYVDEVIERIENGTMTGFFFFQIAIIRSSGYNGRVNCDTVRQGAL